MLEPAEWFAQVRPIAARVGLRPWELEALTVAEFYQEVEGAVWRWQRMEDLAGLVGLYVLGAAGGGKREDGTALGLEDLLGRPPVRLIEPRPLTPAELEEHAWEEEQAEIRRARANLLLYKVAVLRAQREGQPGPTVVGGGE